MLLKRPVVPTLGIDLTASLRVEIDCRRKVAGSHGLDTLRHLMCGRVPESWNRRSLSRFYGCDFVYDWLAVVSSFYARCLVPLDLERMVLSRLLGLISHMEKVSV